LKSSQIWNHRQPLIICTGLNSLCQSRLSLFAGVAVGGLGRSCCVFRNPVVHLGDWQSVVGWQVDSGGAEEEEAYVCQAFCCAVKWQDPTISLDRRGLAFAPTLTLGKRSAMPFTPCAKTVMSGLICSCARTKLHLIRYFGTYNSSNTAPYYV
jgi:hypothetical protein